MLSALRKRLERDEDGFTLIELMVVVLIIAILLAIAIPTFLGARDRANNRAAQSSVRNTLSSAKTLFADNQDYTNATQANLTAAEPSLTFVDGSAATGVSDDFKKVSVYAPDANTFVGAVFAKSKNCYWIKDSTVSGGGTTYAEKLNTTSASCYASASGLTFDSNLSVGWK